jgi:hypothetical protein
VANSAESALDDSNACDQGLALAAKAHDLTFNHWVHGIGSLRRELAEATVAWLTPPTRRTTISDLCCTECRTLAYTRSARSGTCRFRGVDEETD